MKSLTRTCLLAFLLAWPSAARADFSAGNPVEVREGDVWSPAEYLGAEGRRHQIRYADGTEEWVTEDRVREAAPDADAPAGSEPDAARDAEREAAREARRRAIELRRADTVEIKVHNRWKPATVRQYQDPLFLISTNDVHGEHEFHWKWVGPERLRVPGEDFEGPDAFGQFDEGVHSAGIQQSLAKARKGYAEHLAEQAAKAEQAERHGGSRPDPFAAPPLPPEQPTTEADRSALQPRPLATADAEGDAAARIDPLPEAAARAGGRAVRLEAAGGGPFESVKKLDFRGETGLIVLEDAHPGKVARIQAERVDLQSGRSRGVAHFDAASLPLAAAPDGSRVLAVSNGFHLGTRSRLDLWAWPRTGDQPEHLVSFVPLPGRGDRAGDLADALLVGERTAVVVGRDGSVSGWDVPDARALWAWSGVESGAGATLSPGGRLVAVRTDGGVALLEAATGRCVFSLAGDAEGTGPLAFSADGRFLAATDRSVLTSWDLEAGRVHPNVALPPGVTGPGVPLPGGRVRVGDRVLEPATGHHGRIGPLAAGVTASVADAGRVYAIQKAGGRSGTQATYTLHRPDPAAGVADLTLQTELLLQEGDRVSLDASGLAVPSSARDGLVASLREQLAARGVEVTDGEPVRLVATSESETKTLTYEPQGGLPSQRERTDVQATQTTLRFAVEADGLPAWEVRQTFGSHAGGMVSLKEGQTIQQAVDEQNAVSGTALAGIRLPDQIPDPRTTDARAR